MSDADRKAREDDLLATTESLEADAERLEAIEDEKQRHGVTDSDLVTLSREAERLGKGIESKSQIERKLIEARSGDPRESDGGEGPRN
jgi:hypothetical protein